MSKQKMTQAQKATSARSGKKNLKSNIDTEKERKNTASKGKAGEQLEIQEPKSSLPSRLVAAAVYFLLFVLLLAIAMDQQGWFLSIVRDLTHGLLGQVAFAIAVPAMLYLGIVHLFSGGQPLKLRTVSVLMFVFLSGCISHMPACEMDFGSGFEMFAGLYQSGVVGTGGGVLCGLVSLGLYLTFGQVLSYVLLIVGAILFLLAAFRITIPSLIRAFQDRPRYEEDEIPTMRPDPSSVIVHTAVQKHHEHKQKARMRRESRQEQAEAMQLAQSQPKSLPEAEPVQPQNSNEMLRQIADDDFDEEEPIVQPVPSAPVVEPPAPVPVQVKVETPAPAAPVVKEEVPEVREVRKETRKEVLVEPVPVVTPVKREPVREEKPAPVKQEAPVVEAIPIVADKKVTAKEAAASAEEVAMEIAINSAEPAAVYHFPPIDLLRLPKGGGVDGNQEMKDNTRRLNETLASFKIEAHISNVTRGPSVTRYEVELEKGVRLNKLTSCADDIALSLGASGVRIAPVPGKISVVGIEVPNQAVTTVSLREVIDSDAFERAKSKSSFSVGKDIGGSCIIGNIAKLPHMLIAGTTGSGKSVCMNSIIISLLYKASPEDVKLIMVDPKMVELGIYNSIPHLLIPVVTDPKKAAGSLQWAVSEMMRRYKSMSDAGVRDLESYNSMIEGQELEGEKLPQVVVIIDELADLMLVAAKEVEESICRIAQMGRAAGIHLIIATQRPSADVITGLMKANIPSRIAFAVASAMESRIILDTVGAEKLVGKGDMLYAPIGCGKPMRVQGCFVSDAEVEAVAAFVKKENGTTNYDKQVMDEIEKSAAQTGNKGAAAAEAEPDAEEVVMDEMLPAAADVVLETGQASVSMLQRRLKLGYARAARIMDLMEEFGIVGPYAGSKPRNILITREQWELMKPELMKTGSVPTSFPQQTVIPEVADPVDEE